MWTREELKTRAKVNLKKYYWMAFLVSLIFSIVSGFGGGNGGGSSSTSDYNSGSSYSSGYQGEYEYVPEVLQQAPDIVSKVPIGNGRSGNMAGLITGAVLGVALVFLVLGLVLSIFVVPVMEIGKNRFYMESRGLGESAGIGKLFWGFSNRYMNIVWTMFLRDLFVGLGYICCVIPGIYLSYCYYMVPYILSENPEMKPMEAMRLSKEMMEGHKFNTWVLELSFLGWILLGLLACCIGTWFVQPYYDATFAELYAVLRRPYGNRLAGFGVPDVVPSGSGFGTYVNPENVYDAGSQYGPNGGYDAGSQYNPNGSYNAGGQYDPNSSYNAGGQYDPNSSYNAGGQYDQNGSCSAGGQYNPNGGYTAGGQHNPNGINNGADGSDNSYNAGGQNSTEADGQTGENGTASAYSTEVSKSEGGPGNGYYLNGEFHPYTDDEK